MRLETASQICLNDTRRLLFFGNLLIVADKTGAIVSVRASGRTLAEKRVLYWRCIVCEIEIADE